MSKPEVRMECWSVVSDMPYWIGAFHDEGQPCRALAGAVYGHPKFPDGHRVTTSYIVGVEGRRIETGSTIYILGEIDPDYLAWIHLENEERGEKHGVIHVPTEEEPFRIKKC